MKISQNRSITFIVISLITSLVFPGISKVSALDLKNAFFKQQPGATDYQGSFGDVISTLLPNVIVVAGVVFMLLIIYGGFLLIVYGGKAGSSSSTEKAKNTITYGAIGLLLVVASFFILQIISTITGIDFINSPII